MTVNKTNDLIIYILWYHNNLWWNIMFMHKNFASDFYSKSTRVSLTVQILATKVEYLSYCTDSNFSSITFPRVSKYLIWTPRILASAHPLTFRFTQCSVYIIQSERNSCLKHRLKNKWQWQTSLSYYLNVCMYLTILSSNTST